MTFLFGRLNMKFFTIFVLNIFVIFYTANLYAQNIVGWLENITLINQSQQISIESKIDSGADHSSIHAHDIIFFQKGNKDWIRFKTISDYIIEAPFVRNAQIKTKHIGVQDRPVVILEICIGDVRKKIEVNLVDRKHFSKPMLVGRSALSNFLIDPTKTYLLNQDSCIDYK